MWKTLVAAFLIAGMFSTVSSAAAPLAASKIQMFDAEEVTEPTSLPDKEKKPIKFVSEEKAAPAPVAPCEKKATPSPAAPTDKKTDSEGGTASTRNDAFIAPRDWQSDGFVVGDKESKTMISAGDMVFINVGIDRVKPGVRCTVYRRLGKARDPETRDFIGYKMRRIGIVEITDANETASTGRVILSSDPIQVGDSIRVGIDAQ